MSPFLNDHIVKDNKFLTIFGVDLQVFSKYV